MRAGLILVLCFIATSAFAGLDAIQAPQDLTPYAKKTDVPALAPVTSVTGKTGDVVLPTVCGNPSIPSGNTVGSTSTETAFASTCTIKASALIAGYVAHLHVGGAYNSGTAELATGRVRITQTGIPAIASDPTIINTGPLNGISGALAGSEWWGDVFITVQGSGTAIDVQGMLVFQAATSVIVPVGNTSTFPIDPSKDLTIYLTVKWGSNNNGNSMQLRTLVAK